MRTRTGMDMDVQQCSSKTDFRFQIPSRIQAPIRVESTYKQSIQQRDGYVI
jgi:hypothetical protein